MGRKLRQYRGALDPSQVAQGMNAAGRNARRLAQDARLLLDSGRFPSAASVALLSVEEAGKAPILRSLALARDGKDLKEAWRGYRSHTRKNVMAGFIDQVLDGARKLDDFAGLFREEADHTTLFDQVKQLGFYTDCLGEAHWSEPEDVVEEGLARQLVQTAEILAESRPVSTEEIELWVEHLGPVWNENSTWMRTALENWYAALQERGLVKEGENAMRTFIREGIRDESIERE